MVLQAHLPRPGQCGMCEKGIEFVFDELEQVRPGLKLDLGQEGLEVSLYHLVEDGVFGTPPLVVCAAFHLRGAKQATPLCLGCPLAPAEPLRPSSLDGVALRFSCRPASC